MCIRIRQIVIVVILINVMTNVLASENYEATEKGFIKMDEVYGIPRVITCIRDNKYRGTANEIASKYLEENRFFLFKSNNVEIKKIDYKTSLSGTHICFQQFVNEIPVIGSEIVVSLNKLNEVTMVTNHYKPGISISTTPSINQDIGVQIARNSFEDPNFDTVLPIVSELSIFLDENNSSLLVWKVIISPKNQESCHIFVDAMTGNIVKREDATDHIDGTGIVFDPDPSTWVKMAPVPYYIAGILIEASDAYKERPLVKLNDPVNSLYYLRGEYAHSYDVGGPGDDPKASSTPDFLYSWDQKGFVEVNCYYHITNFIKYIRSLGIDPIFGTYYGSDTKALVFDARGTDDQDAYYDHTLDCVRYGVPYEDFNAGDDQSAIIHEVGHALHDRMISGGTDDPVISDCKGISEGISDYFGIEYRRSIEREQGLGYFRPNSSNNWFIPDLRTSILDQNSANFSTWNRFTDKYVRLKTWASALMDLEYNVATDPSQGFRLGREVVTTLQLESLPRVSKNSTPDDYVIAMYETDIEIFNGVHLGDLIDVYTERRLFNNQIAEGGFGTNHRLEGYKLFKSHVEVGSGVNLTLAPHTNAIIDNTDNISACLLLENNSVLNGELNSILRIHGPDAVLFCDASTVKDLKISNKGSIFIENTSIFDNVQTTLDFGSIDFDYPTGIYPVKEEPEELTLTGNSELLVKYGVLQGSYQFEEPNTINLIDGSSFSVEFMVEIHRIKFNVEDLGKFNYPKNCLIGIDSEINVSNWGTVNFLAGGNYTPTTILKAGLGGQIVIKENSILNLNPNILIMGAGSRLDLKDNSKLSIASGYNFVLPSQTGLTVTGNSKLTGNFTLDANSRLTVGSYSELRIGEGSYFIAKPNSKITLGQGAKLIIEKNAVCELQGPLNLSLMGLSKIIAEEGGSIIGDTTPSGLEFVIDSSDKGSSWCGIELMAGSIIKLNNTKFSEVTTAISGLPKTCIIQNSTFNQCNSGIVVEGCDDLQVEGCTFTGMYEGVGISLAQSEARIIGNTIENYNNGLVVISSQPYVYKNTIHNNIFSGLYTTGLNSYPKLVYVPEGNTYLPYRYFNNKIYDNGYVPYLPDPHFITQIPGQICVFQRSGIYMQNGHNNVFSNSNGVAPNVPCIVYGASFLPANQPELYYINVENNYWGSANVTDDFFLSGHPFYIDYYPFEESPWGQLPATSAEPSEETNSYKLFIKALSAEFDGKYDKAIKDYLKIIDKYPESEEVLVAYAQLLNNYIEGGLDLEPLIAIYDENLALEDESVNKKFFKEMKVSTYIKGKKYDEAIAISQEMILEADSEDEELLCEIDISIASILKGDSKGRGSEDQRNKLNALYAKLGGSGKIQPASITESALPTECTLYQNYPNPFNPVTQIKFDLAKTSNIKLSVYNINGQLVSELANGVKNAGYHVVDFDGSKLNSGIYYYTLEVDGRAITKKMVLMK